MIPRGSGPGVSVGHTCTFSPSSDGGKGRILIVGGANPRGSFSHSHIINLGTDVTCFKLFATRFFLSYWNIVQYQ